MREPAAAGHAEPVTRRTGRRRSPGRTSTSPSSSWRSSSTGRRGPRAAGRMPRGRRRLDVFDGGAAALRGDGLLERLARRELRDVAGRHGDRDVRLAGVPGDAAVPPALLERPKPDERDPFALGDRVADDGHGLVDHRGDVGAVRVRSLRDLGDEPALVHPPEGTRSNVAAQSRFACRARRTPQARDTGARSSTNPVLRCIAGAMNDHPSGFETARCGSPRRVQRRARDRRERRRRARGRPLPALRGQPAAGGRARRRQDDARQGRGAVDRGDVQPGPGHARPAALRPHRRLRVPPGAAGVRVRAGADLRQRGAGRRDQPRDAPDPVRAAGAHGGTPGHRRRRGPRRSPTRSSWSPPRTRPSTTGPIPCPRASSTGSPWR